MNIGDVTHSLINGFQNIAIDLLAFVHIYGESGIREYGIDFLRLVIIILMEIGRAQDASAMALAISRRHPSTHPGHQ